MIQNIEHKFINLDERDFHMHTSSFSDGLNTIEEVVQFAGKIGLTEICITDHSQAAIDKFLERNFGFFTPTARWSLKRWGNVHNDVKVSFGVEGDLLNKEGEVCFHIQREEPEFIILAAHNLVYQDEPHTVTEATIKAIEKHHKKIKFIAHPCNNADFGEHYDIERLVEVANDYKIPLEFNAKNLQRGKTNMEKLHYLLQNADKLYLNSDAHSLLELQEVRPLAKEFLKNNGYIRG